MIGPLPLLDRMKTLGTPLCAVITAVVALGCGAPAMLSSPSEHDTPVAADEPRAELKLKVDLTPEQGCEEAFDLAMYKDRGVDLIQWDAAEGTCAGRVIVVRYFPKQLSAEALLEAAKGRAVKAEAITEK